MSYLNKVIQPDETLIFQGHLHWIIYMRAKLLLLLGILLLIVYFADRQPVWLYAALGAGVLGLLEFLGKLLTRMTTEIAVTDRRVIYKTGLLAVRTMEMNVSKIETVDVRQSVAGRIFGYGTILIRGIGSSYEPLTPVASPLLLRNAIVAR